MPGTAANTFTGGLQINGGIIDLDFAKPARGSMSLERFGVFLREHLPLPRPRVVHSINSANA